MSNIDKQAVQEVADLKAGYTIGNADVAILNELARIALASLEAEAVAYMYKDNLHADARFSLHTRFGNWSQEDINEYEITEIPLYTAPPAPVSVPDENGLLPCPCCGGRAEFDYDDDNLNWISCNVCGISTDTAYHTDVDARDRLRDVWNLRAAMLQGAENAGSPTTMKSAPTLDSLPKIAESPSGNSQVIQDGWVACSERLPPEGYEPDGGAVCYLVWHKNEVDCGPQYSISNVFFLRKHWEKNYTHWMPLPAAPQREGENV
ncbi:DUF551 domain-containing protein [Enterobacter cloacae]|uniref:Lar family restriction alleviation protein n=1 Tax=Enterobacter cloacae TaxID=550 RepID=UPI00325A6E4D